MSKWGSMYLSTKALTLWCTRFLPFISYNNGLLLRIMSQINPFYILLLLVIVFDQSKQSENIPVICIKWSEIVSLMDMNITLCCGPFSRRNTKEFGKLGCQNHRVLEAEFDGVFCGSLKHRNSESNMIVEDQITIQRKSRTLLVTGIRVFQVIFCLRISVLVMLVLRRKSDCRRNQHHWNETSWSLLKQ